MDVNRATLSILRPILCLTFLLSNRISLASLVVKDQPPLRYIKDGDIIIGAILTILGYDPLKPCSDHLDTYNSYHHSEAIAFAIDLVNKNKTILPNITLGFVILDDCSKQRMSAIHAISFFKSRDRSNHTCSVKPDVHDSDLLPLFDVAGVIGCLQSSNTMTAAQILGPAQVPLISFLSSSAALDDSERYPYFLRVIPSDSYLFYVLNDFIKRFKWRYVSVIYSEGSYGESMYEALKRMASQGICIATAHKIYRFAKYEDYLWIMNTLLINKKARVVIIWVEPKNTVPLIRASREVLPSGWFIWLCNSGWTMGLEFVLDKSHLHAMAGAFAIGPEMSSFKPYMEYSSMMSPRTTKNPWFHRFWQDYFDCDPSEPLCYSYPTPTAKKGFHYNFKAYEAVLTYAYGIESLLKKKCPGILGKRSRDCITGPELLHEMKSNVFYGPSGVVEFDEYGNILSKFVIEQFQMSVDSERIESVPVAIYNSRNYRSYYLRNLSFKHLKQEGFVDGIPQSVCSKPCKPGENSIVKAVKCCWDCRKCRSNEVVIKNFSMCLACPDFSWPDQMSNFTKCQPIKPQYPVVTDPVVLMQVVMAVCGLVGVFVIGCYYYKYRNACIIKASSKELSYLQLMAIVTGYLTVLLLSMKPVYALCITAFFMYCLSFAWLYAPLLVKTIRIHRIFTSSTKKRLKYISPNWQIVFAALLISVQVILCIIVVVLFEPSATLKQAIKTEKFTELTCEWTVPGLGSFLAYNLVLVCLCSVFAFKTRRLPDNFNESRFISVCVYTTLIIWLAFAPAYFTAKRQYMKTLLLSLSLILNHTVAIVFLYLPKIYASINNIPTSTGDSRREELKVPLSGYSTHEMVTQTSPSPCDSPKRIDDATLNFFDEYAAINFAAEICRTRAHSSSSDGGTPV